MYDFTVNWRRWNRHRPRCSGLFAALHGNQDATLELYPALTGSRPLPAFMNPENVCARICEGAREVLRPFTKPEGTAEIPLEGHVVPARKGA